MSYRTLWLVPIVTIAGLVPVTCGDDNASDPGRTCGLFLRGEALRTYGSTPKHGYGQRVVPAEAERTFA
jgi:hypothetical protein